MAEHSETYGDRAKVWALIRDIKFALMVTRSADGKMSGRPMAAINKDFDGDLWFFSHDASPKVTEMARDPNVLLAYSEPKDQNYISIAGTSEIVRDKTRIEDMWSEGARVWFPKGPNDPDICLIRVSVESAEFWDAPSSAWVYAYGYAKARLTGEPPRKMGENKIVNF